MRAWPATIGNALATTGCRQSQSTSGSGFAVEGRRSGMVLNHLPRVPVRPENWAGRPVFSEGNRHDRSTQRPTGWSATGALGNRSCSVLRVGDLGGAASSAGTDAVTGERKDLSTGRSRAAVSGRAWQIQTDRDRPDHLSTDPIQVERASWRTPPSTSSQWYGFCSSNMPALCSTQKKMGATGGAKVVPFVESAALSLSDSSFHAG